MFNGRRQPSCGGTSRMTRECQVRFCEGLGVKFPGPTRQKRTSRSTGPMSALGPISAVPAGSAEWQLLTLVVWKRASSADCLVVIHFAQQR